MTVDAGHPVAALELGTGEWFDAVNAHLGRRPARGAVGPLLADLAEACDLERALELGTRNDPRHISMSVAITGSRVLDSLHVAFSEGHFHLGPGLLSCCDAVARLDAATARDAFREGTDTALVTAVMDGRAAAAGSWDAISFVRVHLVPEWDVELRRLTA